jgi:AcrR family transcriptional regulator
MKYSTRLSSEARREAIVQAVRTVFAEKGFDGTTTRELAKAAGVSEALLYKHFPSKQSLYGAMLDACARGPAFAEFSRILALQPSTSTLVILVHFLVSHFVQVCSADAGARVSNRLMLRSLLEDGEFIRLAIQQYTDAWVGKFADCLKAAAKAGDLRQIPLRRDLRGWFVHHVGVSLMLHLHPKVPAVDYKARQEDLIEQAVWFCLLGAGLKEATIKRYYNPKALALLAS